MRHFKIFILLLAMLPALSSCNYNSLVEQKQGVEQQWAEVQNQYQRRADLIPNLVNTVKGYATHESSTLEKVTQALLSAYRKDHEGVGDNLTVEADEQAGVVRMFLRKDVVEEVDNGQFGIAEDLPGTCYEEADGSGGFWSMEDGYLEPFHEINVDAGIANVTVTSGDDYTLCISSDATLGGYSLRWEVKDGKLKCIRSLLDEDFAGQNCCVIAMNRTFTQENPVISKKIVQAVQKAHSYMRDNSEEATKLLLEQGWNGGDYEMNVMLNNSLQFGLAQDFTQTTLTDVVGRYIRLGLITSMDNVDEVMELAWNPVL